MSNATQCVEAYHERTKHRHHRFAASPGQLDWANQPDPFRRFLGAPLIPLPFVGKEPAIPYDDLFERGQVPTLPFEARTIGQLFELSMGLSAWKQFKSSRWALRINPSSGNLHPTEAYLVTGAITDIGHAPGVYHYAPKEHAIERRCELPEGEWAQAIGKFGVEGCLIGLTSIHWREAWKYGERAYRYCQLDIGHAIAAIGFSAALLGWRCRLLDGLSDAAIAALLGLDRDDDFRDAEREEPDALLAITSAANEPDLVRADQALSDSAVIEAARRGTWYGRASRLSVEHVDWPVIEDVAQASRRTERQGTLVDAVSPATRLDVHGAADGGREQASTIIRRRRSAVAFDGRTSIGRAGFEQMLRRILPNPNAPPWSCFRGPAHVHLGLFVHRVEGLSPGLYILPRSRQGEEELDSQLSGHGLWKAVEPLAIEPRLYGLRLGDMRSLACQVSCGQEIASDGAFAIAMFANLSTTLRIHGPWTYRRLHWEAGAIGQVFYLEAEACGLRGTGIGCFFDEPSIEAFGLSGTPYRTIYHFTVGGPVEDARLTTHPPYDPRRRD